MSIDDTLAKLDALIAPVAAIEAPFICPSCLRANELPAGVHYPKITCRCGERYEVNNDPTWPPPGGRPAAR